MLQPIILANTEIGTTQSVLIIVLLALAIILSLYAIITLRKIGVAAKKVDYFFEDLTYKSEMLNATVDTVARVTNYVDIFDAFAKRNVKSWVKVATKNKDIVYKLVEKLRDFANSED
ncbi:hypothetical protein SCLARK_00447 [Spiroplasma clarkii]|uniref:DUF948 domain-containing protein n=1 Tax=Spiroplasma clarkii TaxID=2139 RepID=A0A1Y0KZK1_9MOLU|nr:hypothetical protein [Spiroplasma clarkii]ARU91166.1 hypothetical protein SCLARK_00447 [Spiroplasma clarkii]ATX70605.1 hypothetical protein SCLAR_v1c02750 [Spiroplasma clarkii]